MMEHEMWHFHTAPDGYVITRHDGQIYNVMDIHTAIGLTSILNNYEAKIKSIECENCQNILAAAGESTDKHSADVDPVLDTINQHTTLRHMTPPFLQPMALELREYEYTDENGNKQPAIGVWDNNIGDMITTFDIADKSKAESYVAGSTETGTPRCCNCGLPSETSRAGMQWCIACIVELDEDYD